MMDGDKDAANMQCLLYAGANLSCFVDKRLIRVVNHRLITDGSVDVIRVKPDSRDYVFI